MRHLLRRYIRESLLREFDEGKCPSCGREGLQGKKFCGKCGAKLGVCPHCSKPLNAVPGQKVCGKCGEKLLTGASGAQDPDMAAKIQGMMTGMQDSWDAATRRFDATNALNAAHNELLSAFNKMMRAYGEGGSEEAIEDAKKKYAAAKDAVTAAAGEDEKTFNAWISAMEKTGVKVPQDLLDAQRKLSDSGKKIVDDADTNLEAMRKSRAEFDAMLKRVKGEIEKGKVSSKKWDPLSNLPPKLTGDYGPDSKAYKAYLNDNSVAMGDNGMYLAYVVGFFFSHDVDTARKLSDAWKSAPKRGHNFEESGNDFSDDVLNAILDSAGGKATDFKK